MRISFINYLLVVLLVSNTLHAAEAEEAEKELKELEGGKVGYDQLGTVQFTIPGKISSLDNLNTKLRQVVKNKKTKTGGFNSESSLKELLDISESIVGLEDGKLQILPAVFAEYAEKQIQETSEPSCFRRIFCCKRQRKNPFESRSRFTPHAYKDWSKSLIKMFLYQQALEELGDDKSTRAKHLENIDEDNQEKKIRDLELIVLKRELKIEGLTTKEELNKELQKVLQEQQKDEEKWDKVKEGAYFFTGIVATFLASYYGVD